MVMYITIYFGIYSDLNNSLLNWLIIIDIARKSNFCDKNMCTISSLDNYRCSLIVAVYIPLMSKINS